jgi:hypothetical protein
MQGYLREYGPKYYQTNKAEVNRKVVVINKRRRHERYALIKGIKESSPCMDCGQKFPYYVMDFDHRDRTVKVMDIHTMVARLVPWDKVQAEISKCDLVCSNCHRLRTYKGQNCYKTRQYEHHRDILDELKSTTPCLDCGKLHKPCQMDFDHIVSKTKKANVAQFMGHPTKVLLEEIAKCHLVCSNCHRVRSHTGKRKVALKHSAKLVQIFQDISSRKVFPADQRVVPFSQPELLGTMSDINLAKKVGISHEMVSWYRRKANVPAFKKTEPWHKMAGTMSDSKLGDQFGVCLGTIWRYRSLNGILSFRQQRKRAV